MSITQMVNSNKVTYHNIYNVKDIHSTETEITYKQHYQSTSQ